MHGNRIAMKFYFSIFSLIEICTCRIFREAKFTDENSLMVREKQGKSKTNVFQKSSLKFFNAA